MDRHIQMAGTDIVYGHGPIVHSLLFLVALVPMVYIVTSTSMFDWWSLHTEVISGVDHSMSDPVGPLLMNDV